MSQYTPKPAPHPLGQHREMFEDLRKQRGLDRKGFPLSQESEEAAEEGVF